jgi:hypothetical protein
MRDKTPPNPSPLRCDKRPTVLASLLSLNIYTLSRPSLANRRSRPSTTTVSECGRSAASYRRRRHVFAARPALAEPALLATCPDSWFTATTAMTILF